MAMTVAIQNLTGAGPASADVTSVTYNREDTALGTTPIPQPSTSPATNFSWVKSLIVNICRDGRPDDVLHPLREDRHARPRRATSSGTTTPTRSGPTFRRSRLRLRPRTTTSRARISTGTQASRVPLSTAPPAAYASGPFSSTGQVGSMIEVVLGDRLHSSRDKA